MTSHNAETVLNMAKDILGKQQEQLKKIGKSRIVITGKSGVGKTTLLNQLLLKSQNEFGDGRAITSDITEYQIEGFPLIIAETKNISTHNYQEIQTDLEKYIKGHNSTGEEKDAVNLAWFCIDASSEHIDESEINLIQTIHNSGIPVIIVLTRGSHFHENDFQNDTPEATLRNHLRETLGKAAENIILVCALDKENTQNISGQNSKGLGKLMQETSRLLPKTKRSGFAQALAIHNPEALVLKQNTAHEIVKWSAGAATAAASVPIPGSDFLSLAPIQGTMLYKIGNLYGVNTEGTNWKSVITSVATPILAGMAAKAVVGSFLKCIPVAGSALGGAISGTSAATVTSLIGESYIEVLQNLTEQNLREGINEPISANKAFEQLSTTIKRNKKNTPKK
ncbi:DUF697 domain-containing protein [Swingsia samuiensis]|uniref:DUF697 domain-containing protein n=1 Tax=Swingsia samuiensis TaxID=1293412 RepID=A0A4Y6UMH5_9PROT|nr:DUF697 domain-containing protein [Swingsia samuiensis]QDH17225.1 DUF697 domain-containing protein [Swingsia samuiensis]